MAGSAYELNLRRKMQLFLIVLVLFFMFSAFDFAAWAGILFILITLLIADCLFLNENQFVFDPVYSNWQSKSRPQYFLPINPDANKNN